MWALNYYHYLALLLCWGAVSVVGARTGFSVDLCPWFYLRGNYQNPKMSTTLLELVTTCSVGDRNSGEYRTSSIDLDLCIQNDQGSLKAKDSGIFTKTCKGCGLKVSGSMDEPYNDYTLMLECSCDSDNFGLMVTTGLLIGDTDPFSGIDDIFTVEDGTIYCAERAGTLVPTNGTDTWPRGIPSPGTKEVSVTVTSFATNISTAISSALSTDTNTATSTLISTVTGSCESASPTTVTKKHKITKTETMNVTQTVQVTSVLTMLITAKPPPEINASLYTTVAAKLSTQ
ncbi:hypothetical protein F5Y04DRAFT_289968 [Hypomontagnella monticulosa]|nr:hypothetical protein F5Y04DRAFT_289968 [Hypomontagnella monticulosa]